MLVSSRHHSTVLASGGDLWDLNSLCFFMWRKSPYPPSHYNGDFCFIRTFRQGKNFKFAGPFNRWGGSFSLATSNPRGCGFSTILFSYLGDNSAWYPLG